MLTRWNRLFAGILWISVGTACSSPAQPGGTDGTLRVACEWPRTAGLQAVAVVPVLVVREGQIVARSVLVRDNPAVTLSGMTEGRVTVLAAGLAGDSTPLVADEVDTLIKAKETARVVLDLRPEQATPERMTIFGPLMGELRRIAADIAARDAAFLAGQAASGSAVTATPSVAAPPVGSESPEPRRALINGLTGGVDPSATPVPVAVTTSGGGGGGGAAVTVTPTPQPSATVSASPTPKPSASASTSAPWGSIPSVPAGGSASASPSAPSYPWTVPPMPSASVPPVP